MSKKKFNNLPELSDNVNENIEMFDEQARTHHSKAKNNITDLQALIDSFRKTVTNKQTVNYVFWRVLELYFTTKYVRVNVIYYLLCVFMPFELYVYQLVKQGEVVYVGKSDRLVTRLNEHKKSGKDFDEVLLFKCDNVYQQDKLENTCIIRLWPKLNKTVRLDLADRDMVIPEFIKITEIKPDFVEGSNLEQRVTLGDDYYYVQGIGFVRKDKVSTPHWIDKITIDNQSSML